MHNLHRDCAGAGQSNAALCVFTCVQRGADADRLGENEEKRNRKKGEREHERKQKQKDDQESERRGIGRRQVQPSTVWETKGHAMIYIRASQLSRFTLSVNISHTSHDPAALSKHNPFKINLLEMTKTEHHLHNKKPSLTSHLLPDPHGCYHRCCRWFLLRASPGRDRGRQGRECFQPRKLPSAEAYHLHANTQTQL